MRHKRESVTTVIVEIILFSDKRYIYIATIAIRNCLLGYDWSPFPWSGCESRKTTPPFPAAISPLMLYPFQFPSLPSLDLPSFLLQDVLFARPPPLSLSPIFFFDGRRNPSFGTSSFTDPSLTRFGIFPLAVRE